MAGLLHGLTCQQLSSFEMTEFIAVQRVALTRHSAPPPRDSWLHILFKSAMQLTKLAGVPVPVEVAEMAHLLWSEVPPHVTPLGILIVAIW